MKKQHAKDLLPLIQAWIDGYQMQTFAGGKWHDFTPDAQPSWNHPANEYRIKPKMRPWQSDEVPIGAFLRDHMHTATHIITGVSRNEPVLFAAGHEFRMDAILRSGWIHSRDFGKSWQPCGVEE